MPSSVGERERGGRTVQTALGYLAGVLMGGLAGAATMLLLAPHQRTRDQIRHRGLILRDHAPGTIDDVYAQVRAAGRHIPVTVHTQAEIFQQLRQDTLGELTDRWSPLVEAGTTAVQGTVQG